MAVAVGAVGAEAGPASALKSAAVQRVWAPRTVAQSSASAGGAVRLPEGVASRWPSAVVAAAVEPPGWAQPGAARFR